jgi:hypothetical protein
MNSQKTVGVLLNRGKGSFAEVVTYSSGGQLPYGVATADFNRDGKADVVVANSGADSIGVLLSNGNGGFDPVVTYGSNGDEPVAVSTADFNGDGKVDVVVANFGTNDIGVLLNNGNGTFALAVTHASGVAPFFVAPADFNEMARQMWW